MKKTAEEFRNWIEKKIEIEFLEDQENSIEVGQFWWYYEGMNIGNEISKDKFFKRVWLVLNNNLWNGLVLIAPITTKYHKRMEKYYIHILWYEKYWLKNPRIIINQIKTVDKKRLFSKTAESKIWLWFTKKVIYAYTNLLLK